jgi:hypothetical protein
MNNNFENFQIKSILKELQMWKQKFLFEREKHNHIVFFDDIF